MYEVQNQSKQKWSIQNVALAPLSVFFEYRREKKAEIESESD